MGPATNAWPHTETNPHRQALLAAADRILSGTPRRSTGRPSIVQLAIEADVKYWIIAQKHTDLRDHFQQLVAKPTTTGTENQPDDPHTQLVRQHNELRRRCQHLERLIDLYATAANELALENQALREQAANRPGTITPLPPPTATQQT